MGDFRAEAGDSVAAAPVGGGDMKTQEFFGTLHEPRIVQAIRDAEGRTEGEIRVFVANRQLHGEDILARARVEFARLGMAETAGRNGVLFYVVPRERRFAVIGDEGVHAACGQEFWDATAEAMGALFREGKFTEGLEAGLRRAGDVLAAHFPRRGDDRNELPDAVARD